MRRWRIRERQSALARHDVRREERSAAWAACAAMLEYPTPELISSLPRLDELITQLPEPVSAPLRGVLLHLADHDLATLQAEYVETFDHTRRCALYLSYFAYGDTRRRGLALVEFKQAYRRAGLIFEEDAEELPDHLCVVLQCGGFYDHDVAWELLLNHRAGVEMLRRALTRRSSPWAGALQAVCVTLPPMRGDEEDAVARLIAEGPPAEAVGLEPYLIDPQIPVGPPSGHPLSPVGGTR